MIAQEPFQQIVGTPVPGSDARAFEITFGRFTPAAMAGEGQPEVLVRVGQLGEHLARSPAAGFPLHEAPELVERIAQVVVCEIPDHGRAWLCRQGRPVVADGRLDAFVKNRYRTWDSGIGKDIEKGKVGLKQLEAHVLKHGEPKLESGRQEFLENLINEFI